MSSGKLGNEGAARERTAARSGGGSRNEANPKKLRSASLTK